MGICHQIKVLKFISLLFISAVFFSLNFCYASGVPTGIDKAFETGVNMPLNDVAVQGAGFNATATFESIIGQVITMVLGLLGVIFLVLAIYGGYSWMMARGNEEMVETAKKTVTNAILGLIVVLSAYIITYYVVSRLGYLVFK